MFVQKRKNLFEQLRLLQEAPGDDAALDTNADQTTTNTDTATQPDDTGEAESTQDDDLNVNVDLDLDEPGTGGDNDNPDNNDFGNLGDDNTDSTTDAGSTDNSNPEEEVKKGNTDLFSSLTAEEQSIKIMELKRLYNDLYTAFDDLVIKLDDIAMEDIDPRIIARITSQMEELRRILQDYIINQFNLKTYYENDVQYSIFLNMFTTIRGVFDEVSKYQKQNTDKKS